MALEGIGYSGDSDTAPAHGQAALQIVSGFYAYKFAYGLASAYRMDTVIYLPFITWDKSK